MNSTEISNKILQLIKDSNLTGNKVTKQSNLFTDLGFNSLAFVNLLLKIEETFSVELELIEMGMCLQINRLIALIEQKVKDLKND